jgi:hypothetical protein
MSRSVPVLGQADFIKEKVGLLLSRYQLSCAIEDSRIEYFLTELDSENEVSFDIVLALNQFAKHIHVCKFYPNLSQRQDSKYLSAACFYLLVHHFGQNFRLGADYKIFLQTRVAVYEKFYASLRDFEFKITREGQGENVDVLSIYRPLQTAVAEIRIQGPAQIEASRGKQPVCAARR